MQQLVTRQVGHLGFNEAGLQLVKETWNTVNIFPSDIPTVRISQAACNVWKEGFELRKRDWASSIQLIHGVQWIGGSGELATWKWFGYSADEAIEAFTQGLQGTDSGIDIRINGLGFDVKTTKSNPVKAKISKTNRYRHEADAYIFAHFEETGRETWIRLLGWTHRADVKPYLRDGGKCWFVRPESLRRDGLLYPMSALKKSPELITQPN